MSYFSPNGTCFACDIGLSHCISPTHNPAICIIVYVLLQVYVYRRTDRTHLLSTGNVQNINHRIKRATPIFILALIRLGVVGSTAGGTAAFIKGDQGLSHLTQEVT